MSEGKKEILLGDCLELMKEIPNGSIDMVLCDLPYGTTACKWDTIIPFDKLWEQYERIIKPNGVIVLTASQPFTSALVMSNPKLFKYEWIWEKNMASNFAAAKYVPLKQHENILVFYKKSPTYNAQKIERTEKSKARRKYKDEKKEMVLKSDNVYGTFGFIKNQKTGILDVDKLYRNPKTVIYFARDANNQYNKKSFHPTQKPVELFEYLIKTYTNDGDLVLDNTAGSGTTAIACLNTNRQFIVMEKEEKYYEIIKKRVGDFNKNFEPKTLFDAGQ